MTIRRAFLLHIVAGVFFSDAILADIETQEINYGGNDVTLKGYIAYDPAIKGKRPGILVVHEWWGHNDYARKRADMLAKLGYTAIAIDMYGDGKQAEHPQDAGKFATAIMSNMPVAQARFVAAMDMLKKHQTTDPGRIAAIGYCFGGGVVLAMARQGLDLDGVVSFHGSLQTSQAARAGVVKAKILIAHGADDPFVKPEHIVEFRDEMAAAKVDMRFTSYEGAKHSFTNPDADKYGKKFNLPLEYNASADKQSWQDMQTFLKEIFR